MYIFIENPNVTTYKSDTSTTTITTRTTTKPITQKNKNYFWIDKNVSIKVHFLIFDL